MTPNCLLMDNQSETFFVLILIYKNRMVKRIIREDEKRNQEETQDWQRSIPSILDPGTPNNLQTIQEFKVQNYRDISVILTAPHRHSSSLDILSFSVCQESKHYLRVIYSLTNVFQ